MESGGRIPQTRTTLAPKEQGPPGPTYLHEYPMVEDAENCQSSLRCKITDVCGSERLLTASLYSVVAARLASLSKAIIDYGKEFHAPCRKGGIGSHYPIAKIEIMQNLRVRASLATAVKSRALYRHFFGFWYI